MAATREAIRPAAAGGKAHYEKLSPGPGKPADEVGAHQRSRFYSAMIELAAEFGYPNVAISDLAERAKVSSRAFYEQFHGKEDCLLRAHELIVRRAAKRVIAAQAGECDWYERLRLAFHAFVRELDREPEAARLALVEVHLDGPEAGAEARKAELLFAAMLADSFGRASDGPLTSPLVVEAIVAGVAEVARRQVLSGKRRAPKRLADELLEWSLVCRQRAAAPLSSFPPMSSSKPTKGEPRPGTSDRNLCLAAVEKLALTEGCASLTVPRIRAAAGISRQSFDAEFSGVKDCLSATRAECLDRVFARVDSARRSISGEAGAGAAVFAICDELAGDPALANLCLAVNRNTPRSLDEDPVIGTETIDRVIRALYGEKAAKRPTPMIQANAGMVWTTIASRVLSSRSDALHRAAPTLAALAQSV